MAPSICGALLINDFQENGIFSGSREQEGASALVYTRFHPRGYPRRVAEPARWIWSACGRYILAGGAAITAHPVICTGG